MAENVCQMVIVLQNSEHVERNSTPNKLKFMKIVTYLFWAEPDAVENYKQCYLIV